jgi:hypothetical protein
MISEQCHLIKRDLIKWGRKIWDPLNFIYSLGLIKKKYGITEKVIIEKKVDGLICQEKKLTD